MMMSKNNKSLMRRTCENIPAHLITAARTFCCCCNEVVMIGTPPHPPDGLMSSINLNLVKFYIIQQEYYRILNDYLYSYRCYKREDYEIDIGISDFSTYYFELRDTKNLQETKLSIILIKFEDCYQLLITKLLYKLNYDVINYIKLFLY